MLRNWVYILGLIFLSCSSKESPTSFSSSTGGYDHFQKNLHATFDLHKVVSIDSVRTWPAGKEMFIRTAFAGSELEDFSVKLIGVVDDGLPTMPLVMLEASDPRLVALGGVAQGMSGSPVCTQEGTIGALSYAFNMQSNKPSFFATPIESMLNGIFSAQSIRLSKTITVRGQKLEPLAVPFAVSGASSKALKIFSEVAKKHSHSGMFISEDNTVTSSTAEFSQNFEPGSPLAVALALGDEVNIAALGTVTYMDGNRIFGFGHPFLWLGPESLPIIEAKVIAEISNLDAPFKFFSLKNNVRGEITSDRLPGVGGILGQVPNFVPVTTVGEIPGFGTLTWKHSLATGLTPDWEAFMSDLAVFSPILNRDDDVSGASFRVDTKITTSDPAIEVNNSRLYAEYDIPASGVLSESLDDHFMLYYMLLSNPYAKLQIKDVHVSVRMIDSLLAAMITKIDADTMVSAGDNLKVDVNLRVGKTEDRKISFDISVPDTFPTGIYAISVGPKTSMFAAETSQTNPDGSDAVALLPDTSLTDLTMDQFLGKENGEDEKTFLTVSLALVSMPADTSQPVVDLTGRSFSSLDSFFVVVDSISAVSDMVQSPPPNLLLSQPTGLVLFGDRSKWIRVKGKK